MNKTHGTADQREQRREDKSQAAKEAAASTSQPNDITQRTNMKRQGKEMHKQDGKSS